MNVVLDTNVLISGLFWTGPPRRILQAWMTGSIELFHTEEIFEENAAVVHRHQALYTLVDARKVLRLLEFSGNRVEPLSLDKQVCSDPDDDKFIACALAAGCRVIISGDRHLLDADGYEGIRVMTPPSSRACPSSTLGGVWTTGASSPGPPA